MNAVTSSNLPAAGQAPDRSQDGWFTKYRLDYLLQVATDRELPSLASRVAIVLVDHLNSQRLDSWPAQETIADMLGVTTRAVRQNIAALIERGHLAVTVRRGRYKGDDYQSNIYRPIVKENRNERSGLEDDKPEQPFLFNDLNRNNHALKPEKNGRYIGTPVPPNSKKEQFEEQLEGGPSPPKRGSPSKNGRRRPSTAWPDGFHLDDELANHAAEKAGWDHGRAFAEFERFENYHRSKGTRFADWRAAWRTWCSNGAKFDRERQPQGGSVVIDNATGQPVATPPPPPNRRSPYQRESNTQRLMRKLQGGA